MELEYRWKDVFRAGRLGVSPRKISVAVKGIFYGILGYSILTYASLFVSGSQITEIWRQFRFIPCPLFQGNLVWYGVIIYVLACLWALFFYLVTLTAISKITFEQLKGDEFYESGEAWSYALKNWKGAFGSPIFLALVIAALILVGLLMGFVGRIPHVGQVLIGLFAFPLVAGAFFIVYLTIVAGVVLISAPAIVSTTGSDTFDTVFEAFSLINDQTWRFIVWEVLLLVTALVCTFIFAYLVKMALSLTNLVISQWAGPREWWAVMWKNAHWYLYMPFLPLTLMKWFPSMFLQGTITTAAVPNATVIGGFLLGLSFHLIVFVVLGYGMAINGAGQTLIYTILVKIKDQKDLLEEEEELFGEEFEEEEEEVEEETSEEKEE